MIYDIFISYRRDGGFDTAKHLYDLLTHDGYSVSFDIDTLKNGDFDVQLLERIDGCKDFILIVDKNAFVRTINGTCPPEQDWLRCELSHALKSDKNIVPVFLSGISGFPDDLPDDIAGVVTKNGPQFNREYFDAFYNRLKTDFLLAKPKYAFYGHKSRSRLMTMIFSSIIILSFIIRIIIGNIDGQRQDMAEYNEIVSMADSLVSIGHVVVRSADGSPIFETECLYQARNLYLNALPLLINDSIRMSYCKNRSVLLSEIVDSCKVYYDNAETINRLLLEHRIITAEKIRQRQTALENIIIEKINSL